MNSKPDDIPQDAVELNAQLTQRLEQHGLGSLPESELPAVTEAWRAIGDHVAVLAKRFSGSGS